MTDSSKPMSTEKVTELRRKRWYCTKCDNVEDREREVICWKCGKGEMVYVASRPHVLDGGTCWCAPRLDYRGDGAEHWVHNDIQ